jgi:peptide/nickel transport system permease protein
MTRSTKIGLGLLIALALLALVGPFVAGDPDLQSDLANGTLQPPSLAHLLGTDEFSRDVFARLAHGARVSLGVGLLAVSVAALLGTLVGLWAGGSRGMLGGALRRSIDIGLAIPRIVVLLVLLSALGHVPMWLFAVVLGATGWPAMARLIRGETLRLRQAQYVTAARALGADESRILLREILPGALPPLLVAATLGVADAMLLEAGLSFLGLGAPPPAASWGGMLLESRSVMPVAPWMVLAPGAALVAATSAATLLGDALRRRLQPDTT